MSRPPTVSVGIPVYNGERFISEAIESVIAQSFDDWELIISDNGSTDATPRICEQFAAADARIRFVRSPVNRGAAWNFNRVLRLSRGEYFKWLAADDYCAPELLATAIRALEKSPDACLAYSPGLFVNSKGTTLYEGSKFCPARDWPARASDRANALLLLLLEDGRAAQVLVFGLVRRSALSSVRPLGGYHAADWIIAMDLVLQGGVVAIPANLTFFRRHRGSSSSARKTWDRRFQQQFYDPRVNGRWRTTANHYRRYFELLNSVLGAPLPCSMRTRLLARTAYAEMRFLAPRLARRARSVTEAVIRGRGRPNNDSSTSDERAPREKLGAS